jgi:hypothetical protein
MKKIKKDQIKKGVLMSDNRKNFIRLAESRTEKALKAIRVLGNLSNPTNYSYTGKDVEEIFSALSEELKLTKTLFKKNTNSNGERQFRISSK